MVDDPNFKALFVSGFYSDKTLTMMLADLTRDVLATGKPYWLFVKGYDSDPRHLWTIPEVKTLAIRLVRLGYLSPLIFCPDIGNPTEKRGWTAYELWLCSRGELSSSLDTRRLRDELEDGSDFMTEVGEANRRCENLVSAENN